MKNTTPLTPELREWLTKKLQSRLESAAVSAPDLSKLFLSPADISSCAEIHAPAAPVDEVWECYKDAREKAGLACQRTRTRAEELERLELDEASADDPRLAATPADPSAPENPIATEVARVRRAVADGGFVARCGEHTIICLDGGKYYNHETYSERWKAENRKAELEREAEKYPDPKRLAFELYSHPPTMTELMETLRAKRAAAQAIWNDRMEEIGCSDIKNDDRAIAANDAIAAMDAAIATLKDTAEGAEWLATDGGQDGW